MGHILGDADVISALRILNDVNLKGGIHLPQKAKNLGEQFRGFSKVVAGVGFEPTTFRL